MFQPCNTYFPLLKNFAEKIDEVVGYSTFKKFVKKQQTYEMFICFKIVTCVIT